MPGTHRGTPISLIPPSMRTFPCRNRSLRALSVQNRPPCVTRWVQLHVPKHRPKHPTTPRNRRRAAGALRIGQPSPLRP
jgi:hypothetical protein